MAAAAIVLMPISGVRSPEQGCEKRREFRIRTSADGQSFIPLFRGRHRTRFGRGYANSWEFSRFRTTISDGDFIATIVEDAH